MHIIALLVFIVVQILFIPLAIIGVILVSYRQMFVSRRLGASSTAIDVLNGRWNMHMFGLRQDVAAAKLAGALPNNSFLGMWLALFPLYLHYKLSGKNKLYPTVAKAGEEGIRNVVINRTIYFDQIIARRKDDVEQFVVMGAGFDTRCYGALKESKLRFFELDQANTQQLKMAGLKKAGIDTSHVRFVEVDFSTEHWYDKLEQAGYDPSKKSLFLWEGVTLYLGEKDVRNTLREMNAHAAAGSVVVADFYALRFVKGELYPGMKSSMKALKLTDEEFCFGIDFSAEYEQALKTFVESEGATVGETFFMGYNTKKGTWMVVAEVNI